MEFSDGRTVGEQIISGVMITLKALLICAFAGVLLKGLDLLLFPGRANPESLSGRHPFVLGIILLTTVTLILISTINRWIVVLPGFLGFCAVAFIRGSILFGHRLGGHAPISGSIIAFFVEFFVLTMFLSMTFMYRNLSWLDRFALIGFVFCVGISGVSNQPLSLYVAPAVGTCLLLLAWLVDRHKRPKMDHIPDLMELEAQRQWHLDRLTESTARLLRERRRDRGGLRNRFNLRF
jgi:hypothetical protein